MNHRYFICKELYEKEKIYVENLNLIIKLIINPTKENKLISIEEFKIMFSEFYGIYNLNKMFLSSI
jgi:hypothetical protein